MQAIFQQARLSEKNSAPRKHHIVPNSYLARWAVDDRVRVTDLRASISYEASPAKVARETDFYRLDSPDLDAQELPPLLLETILSHIEGKGKSAIDTLLASSPGQLTLYEAIDLANFMAFSFTRGQHFREQMARVADNAMKLMWSRISDEGIRKQLIDNGSEATDEAIASVRKFLDGWNAGRFFVGPQRASLAGTAADLATEMFFSFLARPWRVYHSLAQIVTCDEPVVLVGGPRHNRRQRSGLASAGVVLFPLDPHHLLVMFHPEMVLDASSMLACDFFTVDTVLLRRLYVLFFI